MLRSMTCFARKEFTGEGYGLSLELRSVNSRFFDLHLKMPRQFSPIENRIRKFLKEKLTRGRVDLYIQFQTTDEKNVSFEPNSSLAKAFLEAVEGLCQGIDLPNDLRVSELLSLLKDAIVVKEEPIEEDVLWTWVKEPLEELVSSALEMARKEGKATYEDIVKRVNRIEELSGEISKRFQETEKEQTEKLKERILSRLSDIKEIDESRIIQEAAILADKLDINEELVRLESHISQFNKYLEIDRQIGRKLDFLVQEINREVNTISTKACDSTISHYVVEIKAELEKIREQLQNVV